MSARHLAVLAVGTVAALACSAQSATAQYGGCDYGGYGAYPGYGYAVPSHVSVGIYTPPVVAYRPAYVVPVRAYAIAPVAVYAPPVAVYAPPVSVYRSGYIAPVSYSGIPRWGYSRHGRLRQIDEIEMKANRYGGYDIDIDYD